VRHCTQCGHVLGLGRFCTNCGHPVAARHADPLSDPLSNPIELATQPEQDEPAWRTDTAERPPRPAAPPPAAPPARPTVAPAAPPRLPPAVGDAPPPPRFPLFADEVGAAAAPVPAPAAPAVAAPTQVPADDAEDDWDEDDWDDDWDEWDGRRSRAVRVVGVGFALAVLLVGGWLVGRALGGDDEPDRDSPSAAGTDPAAREPVDHTADATAEAPRTAPATQDVDGNPTSYDASNMLDGVPETAWRVAGDGTGLKLVFTFPERTRISEVGLVNGYAKTATDGAGRTFDWYAGHRRITQVTWNFGVGDVVRQDLEDGRDPQTVEVGPVETRKVVLKIVATTDPGDGPAGRNFTAISDVVLTG
jgi:hypothetical protein